MQCLIAVLVMALVVATTMGHAMRTTTSGSPSSSSSPKPQQQQQQQQGDSVLCCSYPDTRVSFGVFTFNISIATPIGANETITTTPMVLKGTASGAYTIHAFKDVGLDKPALASKGASLNTHGRFSPDGTSFTFSSTREKATVPMIGWSTVFVSNVVAGAVMRPVRLTPPNVADYSPAWSPSGKYIAVASGGGAAAKSSIVIIEVATRTRIQTGSMAAGRRGSLTTLLSSIAP
jgi:hypothetical protein